MVAVNKVSADDQQIEYDVKSKNVFFFSFLFFSFPLSAHFVKLS